jgi:hypothetical protein
MLVSEITVIINKLISPILKIEGGFEKKLEKMIEK